jgi:hypothetical protein
MKSPAHNLSATFRKAAMLTAFCVLPSAVAHNDYPLTLQSPTDQSEQRNPPPEAKNYVCAETIDRYETAAGKKYQLDKIKIGRVSLEDGTTPQYSDITKMTWFAGIDGKTTLKEERLASIQDAGGIWSYGEFNQSWWKDPGAQMSFVIAGKTYILPFKSMIGEDGTVILNFNSARIIPSRLGILAIEEGLTPAKDLPVPARAFFEVSETRNKKLVVLRNEMEFSGCRRYGADTKLTF